MERVYAWCGSSRPGLRGGSTGGLQRAGSELGTISKVDPAGHGSSRGGSRGTTRRGGGGYLPQSWISTHCETDGERGSGQPS